MRMDGQDLRKVTEQPELQPLSPLVPGRALAVVHVLPHRRAHHLPAQLRNGVEKEVVAVRRLEGPRRVLARRGWLYASVSTGGQFRHLPGRGWSAAPGEGGGRAGARGFPHPVARRGADRLRLRPRRVPAGLREGRRRRTGRCAISQAGVYATSPSWSPAGDRIAYTARSGGRFSSHGRARRVGPPAGRAAADGDCEDPSFSPDGRSLVYTFQKKGLLCTENHLIGRSDGNGPWSPGLGDVGSPAWSPGGADGAHSGPLATSGKVGE